MNVLLTSVGRRSYLARYFQQAIQGKGRVVATNSHADAPGMYAADLAIVVPASHTDGYADTIIDICRRHEIDLLCSCHDLDTLSLAGRREDLLQAGVIAMLPDAAWALTCLDKYACGNRLSKAGFEVPWSTVSLDDAKSALTRGEVRFPLVVKARLGFGSLALNKCGSFDELEALVHQAVADLHETPVDHFFHVPPESSVLIQECVSGPERCIGLVNDLSSRYAGHFICEVHSMRAGESDKATSLDPALLGDLPYRLSSLTRHIGIWGIDVLMDNGRPKIIDINPRFSGDYPFHHLAGANVPAALCAWAVGLEHDPQWLKSNAGVSGYKDLVPTMAAPVQCA